MSVEITSQVSLKAWKQIADERLAAVEMYKDLLKASNERLAAKDAELEAAMRSLGIQAERIRDQDTENSRLREALAKIRDTKLIEGFHTRQAQALQGLAAQALDLTAGHTTVSGETK